MSWFSASQCRPVLGAVKVVPARARLAAARAGLHPDPACAPGVPWQLRRTRHHQDQPYRSLHTSGGFSHEHSREHARGAYPTRCP